MSEVPGITLIRRETEVAVYKIGSGEYHFTAK
jgi:hypothetical protein